MAPLPGDPPTLGPMGLPLPPGNVGYGLSGTLTAVKQGHKLLTETLPLLTYRLARDVDVHRGSGSKF